jgi:hypothetical protein
VCDPGDLESIRILSFRAYGELGHGSPERLKPIESQSGRFDFRRHKEKNPADVPHFFFESRTHVCGDSPSAQRGCAAEKQRSGARRIADFNQDVSFFHSHLGAGHAPREHRPRSAERPAGPRTRLMLKPIPMAACDSRTEPRFVRRARLLISGLSIGQLSRAQSQLSLRRVHLIQPFRFHDGLFGQSLIGSR